MMPTESTWPYVSLLGYEYCDLGGRAQVLIGVFQLWPWALLPHLTLVRD